MPTLWTGGKMRTLIIGDTHITDKKPQRRLDANYLDSVLEKLVWCFKLAAKKDCGAIVIAGDVFDSAKVNHQTVSRVLSVLPSDIPVYAIYGQHDLLYHGRNIENTPLNVLQASGYINILDSESVNSDYCGVSWEEPIESKGQKILVIHQMMSNVVEPFECTDAAKFLRKHKEFDLIVSGDNHKQFVVENEGRFLVNPGSLMRTTTKQFDHEPAVYIWTDGIKVLQRYPIPVKPIREVFDLDHIEEEQEKDEKLEAFISGLSSDTEIMGLDFLSNLRGFMRANKVRESVRDLIETKLLIGEGT